MIDNEPTDRDNITINVKWNNEEYNCQIRRFLDEYTDDGGNTVQNSCYVFGNVSSIDSNYSDTAPFLIYANYNPQTHKDGETYIVSQNGSTGEVSCEFRYSYEYWGYQKLDSKYLNLATNVFQNDDNPVTSGAVYEAIQSAINNEIQSAINNKIRFAIDNEIQPAIDNKIQSAINTEIQSAIDNKIQSAINNEIQSAIDNKIQSAIGNALGGSY